MHFLHTLLHLWAQLLWLLIRFIPLTMTIVIFSSLAAYLWETKCFLLSLIVLNPGNGSNILHVYGMGWAFISNRTIIYAWANIWSQSESGKGNWWLSYYDVCVILFALVQRYALRLILVNPTLPIWANILPLLVELLSRCLGVKTGTNIAEVSCDHWLHTWNRFGRHWNTCALAVS